MYQVGDTVYGSFGRYGNIDVKVGKVVKATPTGRINVDFGEKLHDGRSKFLQFKDGHEIGGAGWHSGTIITEDAYLDLRAKQESRRAVSELKTHCNRTNFDDKSDILKFIGELQALARKIPDSWTKGV